MEKRKATKTHRDRKNPRSAELYAERRKATNAARGKQIWIEDHWERMQP